MKQKRIRFIYWALLISIAAHFTLAPIVGHLKVVEAEKEVASGPLIIVRVPKPTPRPTPTPPPVKHSHPTPARKPIHEAHPPVFSPNPDNTGKPEISVAGDKVNANGGDHPSIVASNGSATSGPMPSSGPTATPKPSCVTPFADATTREKYAPEMPELAREQGLSGTAHVQVQLSATGSVTAVKIFESTGNSALDDAALEAARRTTYSPKIVDCERVPGTYLFRVEFENN